MRKYFNKADKNGDGSLTKEEWHQVLNQSGVPTSMWERKLAKNLPVNSELCFREEVQEFFNDMDRDFDEKLTFEEFMGEESHIEKVFKSMDKNGDGFVTKEEFQNVCKNLSDEQVRLISNSYHRLV